MNDDDASGDDLPIIDVRAPAERFADSRPAGLGRWNERLREIHLDCAALLWMTFVVGVVGVQIYGAIAANRFDTIGGTGWVTATLLAASGGYVLTFGCMIGIALAAWTESGLARAALVIAVIGGAWAFVASLIGVAVVFHRQLGVSLLFSSFVENRAVAALGVLMQGALGVVVVLVAGLMLRAAPAPMVAELG